MIVVIILLVFAGHICPICPCFFFATWPFMHQDHHGEWVIVPGWLFVEIGNEPFWWVWTDSIGSLGFFKGCTGDQVAGWALVYHMYHELEGFNMLKQL